MQRLPSVNPFDTSKYPNGIGTFNVGAADDGSKILFYNESPANIDLDFLNGSTDVLHAWEANFWTLDADTKQIEWMIDANSLNVSTPPVSAIFMTLYAPSERIGGTYPMALIRQASVGNLGGIQTTGTTGIINDGNNAGTSIVEATVAGQSSSSVLLTNDALLTLKVIIAAALVQVLKTLEPGAGGTIIQLGAATYLAEVLGNLKVDGTFESAGAATLDAALSVTGATTLTGILTANGDIKVTTIRDNSSGAVQITLASTGLSLSNPLSVATIDNPASGNSIIAATGSGATEAVRVQSANLIRLQVPGGTDIINVSSTALALTSVSGFQYRNGNTEHNISTCSFSATGTVNHNLGETPFDAYITCQVVGSETVGYDSLNATTAHVTVGAALSAKAIWRV